MSRNDAGVSRMLANYEALIRHFVAGDMSAVEFETSFLSRFKSDTDQVVGEEFDILDGLFADVDDYVADPDLRQRVCGISGDELKARASIAYDRLFR